MSLRGAGEWGNSECNHPHTFCFSIFYTLIAADTLKELMIIQVSASLDAHRMS